MTLLAQTTADRLNRAITTAPAAVYELMLRYGCEVPASPEALALLAQVSGEPFVDDLFILLGQAERAAGGRYAGATGTGSATTTSGQRSALGAGLQAIADWVKSALTIKTAGSAGGVDYDATTETESTAPAPRILGLAQPVFIAGVVVLLLAAIVLLVKHHGKGK